MCKRVRVPAGARNWFTANELYGWPDSIRYEPAPLRIRRKRKPEFAVERVAIAIRMDIGRKLV